MYSDPTGMLHDPHGGGGSNCEREELIDELIGLFWRFQVGGALTPKDYMGGDEQNCEGFVLGKDEQIWPGKLSSKMPQWDNVLSVALAFKQDCKEEGRSCRFLFSPFSFVGANEYKIALRISRTPSGSVVYGKDFHDYHFMVLAADGLWYERKGRGGKIESHTFSDFLSMTCWKGADDSTEYDSVVVYFAIGVK